MVRFYGAVSLIIIQILALSFPFSAFTERIMNIYIMGNVFIQLRYVVVYEQSCWLKWLSLSVFVLTYTLLPLPIFPPVPQQLCKANINGGVTRAIVLVLHMVS